MRDIAREMGMEAASLYNHISSKQLILNELLMEIAELFTARMTDIKIADQTYLQKLEELVSLHVQMTVDFTDAISLIPNEWVHLKEPYIKDFLKLRDQYEKDFREIVVLAIKAKQLAKVNPDVALFSILSTLRWLYSWYTKNKGIDVEMLKRELIQDLLYGLRSK